MTSPYRSLLDVGRQVEVPRFPFKDVNDRPGVCYVRLAFDQAHQNVLLLLVRLTPKGDQADLTQNLRPLAMQILDSVLSEEEWANHRYRVIEHTPAVHDEFGRDSFALISWDANHNPGWNYLSPSDIRTLAQLPPDFLTLDPAELTL